MQHDTKLKTTDHGNMAAQSDATRAPLLPLIPFGISGSLFFVVTY